ncbi:hypothetical protein DPM19_15640 [Actinomadura craniellae]|uniref:DUF8129 domain-containing protein n=1 Tax=Actinomadura craniellae TaxID=2231787 RepID=A0A365H5M2_9ACTN|nr:hypothetical protein DPM19_15640 [Actinomadura craniellae]
MEEQVRDLPLHAVRLAMFGVGRALLLSDRVTKDYKELREGGVGPVLGRLRDDAQHTAGKVVTGVFERVRGSGPEPAAAPRPTPRPAPKPAARPSRSPAAEPEIVVGKPAAEPKPAPSPVPSPAPSPTPSPEPKPTDTATITADSLPVPNYDQATLAALRARLRGLTAAQVSRLRDYERQHAARPEVLRMYENRLIKLAGLG